MPLFSLYAAFGKYKLPMYCMFNEKHSHDRLVGPAHQQCIALIYVKFSPGKIFPQHQLCKI